MSRQHPWLHVMGNRILISITVSDIWDHCQNLLDDPRILFLLCFLQVKAGVIVNLIAVFILFICLVGFIIPAFDLQTIPDFVLREHNLTKVVTPLLNDTLVSYNLTAL